MMLPFARIPHISKSVARRYELWIGAHTEVEKGPVNGSLGGRVISVCTLT